MRFPPLLIDRKFVWACLLALMITCLGVESSGWPDEKVYDRNWKLQYRIEGDRIYDRDWKLQHRLRDGKIYDRHWRLQGRIRKGKIYDRRWRRWGTIKGNGIYDRHWRLKYRLQKSR